MLADRKITSLRPWIWVGFGIGVSVALLTCLGISGLLFLIERVRLPEEEMAIFTSLFYGIVFFIALGSVCGESRRHKMLVSRTPFEAPSPPKSKSRETLVRIRTLLWYIFSLISLGWLTPTLIVYWANPKHPGWAISACAYLFSLVTGTVYLMKRTDRVKTGSNYIMLYVGVCLGAFLVDRIICVLHP